MIVREERPGDLAGIESVTIAAFRDHPHSDQTEHLIIARLRVKGALAVSLVAVEPNTSHGLPDTVIGHIAFSPIGLSSGIGGWCGLGPVSVRPDRQGQGIGRALVEAGLSALRNHGASGCVVMGDPDFYRKFGFENNSDIILKDCAPQYFLALPLSSDPAFGIVAYDPAFFAGG